MILCEQELQSALLEKIAALLTHKDIELVLLDSKAMRDLNLAQRKIDKSTDVLAFPLSDESGFESLLGSIVINLDEVSAKAAQLGHSEEEELALLFMHALLHLLGFDHEKDEGQMRAKEEELIRDLNLPQSLIVRNLA